ncbi:unnamed protein product [Owenia fusiformis]|uniref:Ribosome biogenesis regulatory protein n=1 Tax=Owenia fusiformis TaxID=6347 RepID=A0A8J1XZ59_OWEFU|nr:unnamed protein product [Owenia fusiformis]
MANTIENILAEKGQKFKSIEVEKDLELEIDEGNLLAVDTNPIDIKIFRTNKEKFLSELARDNTQLLLNRIWELPTHRKEDVILAKLPEPKTIIPREKPVPKEKAATKWEKYAALKGIQKSKKSRMVWDETHQEYRPRWGYKRANDDTKDWLIEVPGNADPYEDQFEKRLKAKKERTAKNELQRLCNIARNSKGKVPGVGLTPTEAPSKDHVSKALALAKSSDASLGKFTDKLPKEKAPKNMGKKRKFEPNTGQTKIEIGRQLDILGSIHKKRPAIDVTKATNKMIDAKQRGKNQKTKLPRQNKGRKSEKKTAKSTKKRGGGGMGGSGGKPAGRKPMGKRK